jgi:hypothetical protein
MTSKFNSIPVSIRVLFDLFDQGGEGTVYRFLDNHQNLPAALARSQNNVTQDCVPGLKDTSRKVYLVTELDSNNLLK